MHFKIVISLLALTGLVACHTPELVLDPSLSAGAMPVKGRNGLQIGQVIRYGDYTTDKVRRGWTKGYDIPFILPEVEQQEFWQCELDSLANTST